MAPNLYSRENDLSTVTSDAITNRLAPSTFNGKVSNLLNDSLQLETGNGRKLPKMKLGVPDNHYHVVLSVFRDLELYTASQERLLKYSARPK